MARRWSGSPRGEGRHSADPRARRGAAGGRGPQGGGGAEGAAELVSMAPATAAGERPAHATVRAPRAPRPRALTTAGVLVGLLVALPVIITVVQALHGGLSIAVDALKDR